jgi:hypothetical protein
MESGVPAITLNPAPRPAPLLFFGAHARGLERTRGLAVWNTCGPREPISPEKLCEPATFCLHPAWGHEVPHVLVPGWPGRRYGLCVGVSEHNVVDEADFGGHALQGQCPSALVLGPEVMVAFDIGFKAIEGAH